MMRVATSKRHSNVILKELVIWVCVTASGFAAFHYFEPLYETTREAALAAGLKPYAVFAKPQMIQESRLGPASLSLRGSLDAGTLSPASGSRQKILGRRVTLVANGYGHFHTAAAINGKEVDFMTDTGATYVALSYETAQQIGIPASSLRFTGRSTTANGVAKVASVTLDSVKIDKIIIRDVQAVVAEPGRMTQNLLGMSFISRLAGFELAKDKLVLTE